MKKLASLGIILIFSLFLTGCSNDNNVGGRVGEIFVIDSSGTYAKLADTDLALRVYGTSKYLGLMGKNSVRFYDNDSSNYVGIRASSTISADVIWDLPLADGTAGQGLITDGNGQLSFSSSAGGIDLTDLSNTATGLTYNNTTGVTSLTAGYVIPVSLPSQNLYIGNALNATEATSSISSSLVAVSSLSGANDDLTNLIDSVFSPGKISGGVITDNGDGTVKVGAGLGMARTTDNETTTMRFIAWAEDASVDLTDNTLNYIIVDYNSGTPSVSAVTALTSINTTTQFPIGVVFRDGNDAEILEDGIYLPNYRARSWSRLAHRGIERMSGGSISASSTMGFGLTATIVYYADTEVDNDMKHVDGNSPMTVYYRNGGTGWTASTSHRIRSTVYDNNSGTPAALTSNRYSVYFIFECLEGEIYAVMGQGDYTLTQAQQAQLPAILPNYLTQFAYPYGKIITQKSAAVFTEIENNVSQNFVLAGATDHNGLSGLQGGSANDYYHLLTKQVSELTALEVGSTSKISTTLASESFILGGSNGLAEASTTPKINGSFLTGTSSIPVVIASSSMSFYEDKELFNPEWPITFTKQVCTAYNGTSIVVNLSDGTNDMTAITAGTAKTTVIPSSNNTFTADESVQIEFGTNTGSSDGVSCTFYFLRTAQ